MIESIIRRIGIIEDTLWKQTTQEIETFTIATLPVSAANGAVVYVSDGPKSDETVLTGTGNFAMWRQATTEWVYYGVGAAGSGDDFIAWWGVFTS
jgi:hypothetical protein